MTPRGQMTVPGGAEAGTRFRIFAQPPWLGAFSEPVTVAVPCPPRSIGPGPDDGFIHVVDPIGKRAPYGEGVGKGGRRFPYLPPWRGARRPPALPDEAGHFDHLEPGAPGFEAAHAYACVRLTLDLFARYRGRPLRYHFVRDYDRLELVLSPWHENAAAGYGFVELGAHRDPDRGRLSFALNFDVLAHEAGHLIVFGLVGLPPPDASGEAFAFHESAADLVALLSAARLPLVADELFRKTRGNLYVLNELNRVAELSETTQIRLASNDVRLDRFAVGWTSEHQLSLPLTGAVFDLLVDVFHASLVEDGLIGPALARAADEAARGLAPPGPVQAGFDAAHAAAPAAFRAAFGAACDTLGRLLIGAWARLDPDRLTFAAVARALLAADRDATGGRLAAAIREDFAWRGIGRVLVGPRLRPAGPAGHLRSVRTLLPEDVLGRPRVSYRDRMAARAAAGGRAAAR